MERDCTGVLRSAKVLCMWEKKTGLGLQGHTWHTHLHRRTRIRAFQDTTGRGEAQLGLPPSPAPTPTWFQALRINPCMPIYWQPGKSPGTGERERRMQTTFATGPPAMLLCLQLFHPCTLTLGFSPQTSQSWRSWTWPLCARPVESAGAMKSFRATPNTLFMAPDAIASHMLTHTPKITWGCC